MLDLKDLIASPLMSMHNIYRYSSCRQVEVESLSDHIVEIQVLGSYLVNILNTQYNEGLDYEKFLTLAFHHDLEESVTGDVVRPLKYHTPEMKKNFDHAAEEFSKQLYDFYFPESKYYQYYELSKEGREGGIVKIVDLLVVAVKAFREVELLGNMYFLKVVHEVSIYLEDLLEFIASSQYKKKTREYLYNFVRSTIKQLTEVKNKHSYIYEEYRLQNNSLIGDQTLEGSYSEEEQD